MIIENISTLRSPELVAEELVKRAEVVRKKLEEIVNHLTEVEEKLRATEAAIEKKEYLDLYFRISVWGKKGNEKKRETLLEIHRNGDVRIRGEISKVKRLSFKELMRIEDLLSGAVNTEVKIISS